MTLTSQIIFSALLVLVIGTLNGCGGEDDTGAAATLTWTPVISNSPVSYTVHYGRQSTGQPGACNYENSIDVSEPGATITGLELNTQYYFAVSAFNGSRSSCSEEVSKLTSPLAVTPSS